ncbi:MAG: chitobiase/beta-hexosaminidase C-terminal domain-containing protein, partial [Verrucomicrobiota bacterium]
MGPENSTTTRITIVLAFVGLIPRLLPAQNDPQRVADTKISIDSGFQTESIEIDLTTATQDAVILYTTDGREPDPGNIFSGPIGEVYAEPIFIDRTTILRVKAFKTGDLLPTNIDTRTYLFPQDVVDQPADIEGWPRPVLSTGQGTARHDYEMDPRVVGEDEQREAMIQSLMALPTMSLVVDPTTIWDATGKGGFYRGDTEEAVHVEILYPDTPGKTEHARGAVQGHSHDRLKRSLRLKFKTEFGDSKFRTDLLKKALHRPGDAPDRFDRLILRAGNNRSWARSWNPDKTAYTMDEWYRATQIAMSGYGARGAFVHLYLNGLYWGLYNLTERPDRWFTSEHFGGEVEDWFAISHGGDQGGNSDPWDQLLTAARADLSQSDAYEEVRSRLDLSGFIDYLLLSWYINVTDWPRNNWWAGIQTEPSGRARFFAWDGEWSFGLGESPGTAWVHPDFRSTSRGGSAPTSVLWNALKKNADFMILVADRAHRHLLTPGGALSDAPSRERWQRLNQTIESAVLAESARWGDALSPERPRTVENDWRREVDRIDSLLQGNSSRLIDRLVEQDYYPDLEPPRISLESGLISPGRPIEVTNPNNKGTIYYTTDGSDPRSPGGGLSTTASEYEAPLQTGSGLHLRLRVLQKSIFGNETWTALVERSFYSEIPSLRVSELMYHPAAPTEAESIAG